MEPSARPKVLLVGEYAEDGSGQTQQWASCLPKGTEPLIATDLATANKLLITYGHDITFVVVASLPGDPELAQIGRFRELCKQFSVLTGKLFRDQYGCSRQTPA